MNKDVCKNVYAKYLCLLKKINVGIYNLWIWTPIIWQDRQWDQHFFYKILAKKLSLIESHMLEEHKETILCTKDKSMCETCTYHSNANCGYNICKEHRHSFYKINLAKVCAEKLVNEGQYLLDALKPFDEKYPDFDWSIKSEKTEDGYYRYFDTSTEEQKKLRKECSEQSEKNIITDIETLFNIIRDNIQCWWT